MINNELIVWISKNKEWLFSGILTSTFFFILGRRSIQWKILFKNNSKTINNFITKQNFRVKVNYKKKIILTVGASGACYTMPDDGLIVVTAGAVRVLVNGNEMSSFGPSAKEQTCQVLVNKEDNVQIYWNGFLSLKSAKIIFYPFKEKINDQ